MKLNVSLVRQEENTWDCGLAGISMFFKYYGIDVSYSQIKKDLIVYEKLGTFAPQIGSYLIKHGLEVEIVILNPYLFSLADKNKSQKELLEYLEELLPKVTKERNKLAIGFFIDFLKDGGRLKIKIPEFEDIKQEIDKKRPVGALLTTRMLQNLSGFNFHFNIVKGYDENHIIALDPMWNEQGGEFSYQIKDFMYALHSSAYGDPDNACLYLVKRR